MQRYREAGLEPVAFSQSPLHDGTTRVVPAHPPDFERSPLDCDILAEYLVRDLTLDYVPDRLLLKYNPTEAEFDGEIGTPPMAVPSSVKLFFPVFSLSDQFNFLWGSMHADFAGAVVPRTARVNGMYRVRNRSDFPVLASVWLPAEPAHERRHYTLAPVFGP